MLLHSKSVSTDYYAALEDSCLCRQYSSKAALLEQSLYLLLCNKGGFIRPFLSASLSGVHCEINIDDCTPFTDPITQEPKCFNQGRCVDRVGGYHCICPAGYVGERCEGDVNECLSNPCDPRGTHSCIQLTNNYRCECRTGYTGTAQYKLLDQFALILRVTLHSDYIITLFVGHSRSAL